MTDIKAFVGNVWSWGMDFKFKRFLTCVCLKILSSQLIKSGMVVFVWSSTQYLVLVFDEVSTPELASIVTEGKQLITSEMTS